MAPRRASRADITESHNLMWYVLSLFFRLHVEIHTLHCPALPTGFVTQEEELEGRTGTAARSSASRRRRAPPCFCGRHEAPNDISGGHVLHIQLAIPPGDAGSCRPRWQHSQRVGGPGWPSNGSSAPSRLCMWNVSPLRSPPEHDWRHIRLVSCSCLSILHRPLPRWLFQDQIRRES